MDLQKVAGVWEEPSGRLSLARILSISEVPAIPYAAFLKIETAGELRNVSHVPDFTVPQKFTVSIRHIYRYYGVDTRNYRVTLKEVSTLNLFLMK